MRNLVIILSIALSIAVLSFTQQVKEWRLQCWSGPNSIYFYIIKNNSTWHYNFTNHQVSDDEMKKMFWKVSKTCPIDTTEYEKLYVKTITEDKLDTRIVRDLNK